MTLGLASVGTPWMYAGFFAAVIAMIVIDIIALNKQGSHKVSAREALGWSAIWISIAMLFNLWLWWHIRTNVDSGLDEAGDDQLQEIDHHQGDQAHQQT